MEKVILWVISSLFLTFSLFRTIARTCRLYQVTVSLNKRLLVLLYILAANTIAVAFSEEKLPYLAILVIGLIPMFYIDLKFNSWAANQRINMIESEPDLKEKPPLLGTRFWISMTLFLFGLLYLLSNFPQERIHLLIRYIPVLFMFIVVYVIVKLKR